MEMEGQKIIIAHLMPIIFKMKWLEIFFVITQKAIEEVQKKIKLTHVLIYIT